MLTLQRCRRHAKLRTEVSATRPRSAAGWWGGGRGVLEDVDGDERQGRCQSQAENSVKIPDGVLSPFKLRSSIYLPENTITQSPPRPAPATLHPPLGSNRKCGVHPPIHPFLPSVDKLIFHTNIQQEINKDQLLFMATACFLASWGEGVGGERVHGNCSVMESKPKAILCIMGWGRAGSTAESSLRSAYQQSGFGSSSKFQPLVLRYE